MKDKKNRLVAAVFAVFAVICAIAGGLRWYRTRTSGEAYIKIQREAATSAADANLQTGKTGVGDAVAEKHTEASGAASTAVSAAVSASTAVVPGSDEEIPIDFQSLWTECPDVYAWIRIPGTKIDYPVCQLVEGDQSFYLNHRADKVEEFAGAIYSENYNKRDFTDPVTVLYGHDMANGTMFQNLHLYEDRAFFDRNREVLIYLPDKVLRYRVFAAYNTNDDHLLLNNDCFRDPDVYYRFLQDILAQRSMNGFVDQNVQLTRDSRVLTLSTCNAYDDQRYLVQCLLVQPGQEGTSSMPAASDNVKGD